MKYLLLMALLALTACADRPVLTSPAQQLLDRAAHHRYLASVYQAQHLANCEYYELEDCSWSVY